MKKRLALSFSGGATSGFMTQWCLENLSDEYEIVVTFANTGWENKETLDFVHLCDTLLGFGTVWLEAVVDPRQGKGTRHSIVTYETASRNAEPFEEGIKKYGIPNVDFPWCTRELKLSVMRSYLRSMGWEKGTYKSAVGIRTDEIRRVSKEAKKEHIIYPLIDLIPSDKQDVQTFWEDQPFQLNLATHRGNCRACWKKSLNKHLRLAHEEPDSFEFPLRMERDYGFSGAIPLGVTAPRVFFRERRSAADIIFLASVLGPQPNLPEDKDANSGCSESCEVFT